MPLIFALHKNIVLAMFSLLRNHSFTCSKMNRNLRLVFCRTLLSLLAGCEMLENLVIKTIFFLVAAYLEVRCFEVHK